MWRAHLYTSLTLRTRVTALLLTVASGTEQCVCLVFTEQSESVKGSELSRSTSIKDRSLSGMTRPCHRHMAGHRYHGQILSLPPPLLSRPLSSPSAPLHPRKRCFCQKPAALSTGGGTSLSLSLTLTYALAYSLVCSCTHTIHTHTKNKSHPTYFSTSSLSFIPSYVSLCVTSHTPSFVRLSCPPCCPWAYYFWQLNINTELLLKLIGVHTVRARQQLRVLNPNHPR